MKVILKMAVTANGYIATEDGGTDWVNPRFWQELGAFAKGVGNIVIGRGTYDILVKENMFPVKGLLNMVMTSEVPPVEPLENVVFFTESAEEAVAELARRGFEEVLVGGGGALNGSFIMDGLVDEIYLDVQPIVFSNGIRLFENADFRRDLELIDTTKASDNEVQLHYGVRKSLDQVMASEAAEEPIGEA